MVLTWSRSDRSRRSFARNNMPAAVMRTLALEIASPKYAQIERERRWLVDPSRRPDLSQLPHILIEDRYIVGTRLRLRRTTSSATGVVTLKITKKYESDDPRARALVTTYLTVGEYDLFATLSACSLQKQRYSVDGFSLDRFAGTLAGLELAERECPDDMTLRALAAPDWVLREVTHEDCYTGGALATNGYPET